MPTPRLRHPKTSASRSFSSPPRAIFFSPLSPACGSLGPDIIHAPSFFFSSPSLGTDILLFFSHRHYREPRPSSFTLVPSPAVGLAFPWASAQQQRRRPHRHRARRRLHRSPPSSPSCHHLRRAAPQPPLSLSLVLALSILHASRLLLGDFDQLHPLLQRQPRLASTSALADAARRDHRRRGRRPRPQQPHPRRG